MGNHETVIINNYNIQLYIISQYKRVRKSNPLTLYPLYYYLSKTNTNFIKRKQDDFRISFFYTNKKNSGKPNEMALS